METNENAILAECQAGDVTRFGVLYDSYFERIYSFIYYRVQHKQISEDIASKTFMKALDKIRTFDPKRGTFSSWIYRIARNTVRDHYRTLHGTVDIEAAWDISSGEKVEIDVERRMQLEQVRKYLKALTPEQRAIVTMRIWDGLSFAEIAEVLGKTESGCKMSYSRTMRKLRESLPEAVLVSLLLSLVTLNY